MQPRYIADFESGDKVLVFDRQKEQFFEPITTEEFVCLEWMKEIDSLAIEAAHGARFSNWSKSQRWKTIDDMQNFWNNCKSKNVDLRFLPESALFTYRKNSDLVKNGTNDILSYHQELLKRPNLWITCQRPENVRTFDPSKDIHSYGEYTPELAGFLYRQELKDASREISSTED